MVWRRFRRKINLQQPLMGEDIFSDAQIVCLKLLSRHRSIDAAIDSQKAKTSLAKSSPTELIALLLLQTPRAVRAQQAMDKHPRGYRDRKVRLYELIDFNDTFVSAVLSLKPSERKDFAKRLHTAMVKFSKTQKTPMFFDGQFDAIVHGLSREIAVYQAALDLGYDAFMSSRGDDAFGIDMQIRDRTSQRYANIDTKTRSSYFFRLRQLQKERRIRDVQIDEALEKGFVEIVNQHNGEDIPIVLLRIDHVEMGDIIEFNFEDLTAISHKLQHVLKEKGLSDRGYGRTIAGL